MTKLRIPALLAVVLVLGALASGCGSAKKSVGANEVAVVGDCAISKEQFDRLLNQARTSYKAQKQPFPEAGTEQYTALRKQAMQFLVQRCEFDQRADDLGLGGHGFRRRQAAPDDQGAVLRQGREVRLDVRGEVPGADQEAGPDREAGPGRRPGQRSPEQALQRGHDGVKVSDKEVRTTTTRTRAVRPAREPRCPAHPRQEEGARRQPLPAAEERRQLRGAGEEVLAGPGLEGIGRQADDLEGPAGARVRQGRVRTRGQ